MGTGLVPKSVFPGPLKEISSIMKTDSKTCQAPMMRGSEACYQTNADW